MQKTSSICCTDAPASVCHRNVLFAAFFIFIFFCSLCPSQHLSRLLRHLAGVLDVAPNEQRIFERSEKEVLTWDILLTHVVARAAVRHVGGVAWLCCLALHFINTSWCDPCSVPCVVVVHFLCVFLPLECWREHTHYPQTWPQQGQIPHRLFLWVLKTQKQHFLLSKNDGAGPSNL